MYCLQDGVYVKGMFLQGAGWDTKNANLVEAEPMQLVCPMPTIHFKPVEGKRKTQKGNIQLPISDLTLTYNSDLVSSALIIC